MGLRVDAKATIWELDVKEKYAVCSMSTQKKDKQNGGYSTDWSNKFVRFIGDAFNSIRNYSIGEGEYIRIIVKKFEVTNNYDKVKKILYTNYVVFDFEFADAENNSAGDDLDTSFTNVPDGNDIDLPFA